MNSVQANNRRTIARYMEEGSAKAGCGKIGLELEHLIIHSDTRTAVTYDEEGGVLSILEELAAFYPTRTQSEGYLIGLADETANITIEPAGQLEISVRPETCLDHIGSIYETFRQRLDTILKPRNMEALTQGYQPVSRAADLPLIPKERYRLMDARFARTGSHGICMMRGSASTQVSIDYTDEADAIRKFRLANLLGPLFAFLCDNSPVLEGMPVKDGMARTQIWNDVDPARQNTVPGLFDEGYGFDSYADWIMSSSPILVMGENDETIDTGDETADEIYADTEIDTAQLEHLLSMFFPDVRLKRYVEIRMADSLPKDHALSYAALIKGLFYDHTVLTMVETMLGARNENDIAEAKTALMEHAYTARVYGRYAFEWLDDLIALAWRGLSENERPFLKPLARLVAKRGNLLMESSPVDASMCELEKEWTETIRDLDGDAEGRNAAWDSLQKSTAIYHDRVVDMGFVPKLIDPKTAEALDRSARMTYGICRKVIEHFTVDPTYRGLFGFDEKLTRLILADRGYTQTLPIARVDIFLDEKAAATMPLSSDIETEFPFMFCEFNTDGTSAMNEDRCASASYIPSDTFAHMARLYRLAPQSLFDPWVRALAGIYAEYAPESPLPRVAIVDFEQSGTPYEFAEFAKRFELHGMPCTVADPRTLVFENGVLETEDGFVIDCIYRRAVTTELMKHADEVAALLEAVEQGAVCMIGGFDTQVCHTKRIFEVLHRPETSRFLSDAEVAFIRAHVPATYLLTPDLDNIEAIRRLRAGWIVKPIDGQASNGVFTGHDMSDEEWNEKLDACMDGSYIVQEYAPQYASENLRIDGKAEAGTPTFERTNNLMGIYLYDGQLGGFYTRVCAAQIIAGMYGGLTAGTMLVHHRYHR